MLIAHVGSHSVTCHPAEVTFQTKERATCVAIGPLCIYVMHAVRPNASSNIDVDVNVNILDILNVLLKRLLLTLPAYIVCIAASE